MVADGGWWQMVVMVTGGDLHGLIKSLISQWLYNIKISRFMHVYANTFFVVFDLYTTIPYAILLIHCQASFYFCSLLLSVTVLYITGSPRPVYCLQYLKLYHRMLAELRGE